MNKIFIIPIIVVVLIIGGIYKMAETNNQPFKKGEINPYSEFFTGETHLNMLVKKDDVSLFTGGEDGVLRSWEFRKTGSGCELRLSNHVNLFSCSLLSLLLNPTQNFVFILFFFFIFSAPRCFSKRRNRCD